MNKSGVYIIKNILNDNFYVGSSKNIATRWYHHKRNAVQGSTKSPYLYSAMRKYGIDNFECTPLIFCEINDLEQYEQYFLDKYVTLDECYNISKDARAPMRRASIETRKKLSEAVSKSTKGRAAWNKGIARTDEERNKIRNSSNRSIDISENKNIERLYFKESLTIKDISKIYEVCYTTIQRILIKHPDYATLERRGGWNKGVTGSTRK